MVIKNKRGWMRILEATIAVMLVSGVLVVVSSGQVNKGISPVDYFYSLQGQILADISSRSDFRLAVLNTVYENSTDGNFSIIKNFIDGKVPSAFSYSLSVCKLGDEVDFCRMNEETYIATKDKDVFAEEIVISAELGSGPDAVSGASKLRFFIWEN